MKHPTARLKPCRCGGSARTCVDWEHKTAKGYMHIARCERCGSTTMPCNSAAEAAEAWNDGKHAKESEPLQMTMVFDC